MVQNDFKHPIDNVTNFLAEYAAGKRNFAKAELSGANLQDVDVKGADLSYADLSGANLSNANFRGCDLSFANLNQANLENTDLRGAMLFSADFRQANLQGTKFEKADSDRTTQFPPDFDLEARLSPQKQLP